MLIAVYALIRIFPPMRMSVAVSMPIRLQMHIKIKGIQTAHHLPAKMQMVSIHSQALQRILQHLPVRSQVKQGSYRHVPADTRITLQI